MRWGGLLFLGLVAACAAALWGGWLKVPPQYNPWAPLDFATRPNLITAFKLMRLKGNPEQCLQTLAQSEVEFTPVENTQGACPLTHAVRVSRAGTAFNQSFLASCPLAVGWELFQRHTLQQAAQQHLGQNVTRVEHLGTYACRNIYNRAEGRRSEHATANAIDIAAFVLEGGTRISVEKDWNNSSQPARMSFLRQVRDGACQSFNVVLGPDYNTEHKNHFHLDMSAFWKCE